MSNQGASARDGWVRIGPAEALRGAGPFGASAGGTELVVVRALDGLRAYEGRCPHQGALLAEGEVAGDELVCRNHRWRFETATGRRRGGEGGLRACPLEARGGALLAWPEALAAEPRAASALRPVDALPGPRGLPLLGALAALDLDRLHLTLERWASRHGPAYRVDLGPRRVVALSDPALIQRALRERPGAFRRLGNVEPIFRELGVAGVFSAEGIEWRPLRRLTMEALSPQHLRSFYPALRAVAARLHRRWGAAADAGRPVDVLLGGEDTTALTLSWAVHELCDHPGATRALQEEADRVLGGAEAPADLEAVARLEVAGAVASETMRLRPVAPLIFLDAIEDTALGDLDLRRGQTVVLLMRPPAVSAEHFAEPGAFRPERWLHPAAVAPHDPAAHMPFGSGPRLCPGRALALLELRVALATLHGGFSVERVGARAAVEERFAFTMGPRGLRVRLRRRQRA